VIDSLPTDNTLYRLVIRLLGSFVCFIFVLFWHGVHNFIIIWTTLNFIGIVVENLGVSISRTQFYNKVFLKKSLTRDRFNAVLMTPLLVMSSLSNFYFFAGSEIGMIYVYRVLSQSLVNFIGMYIIMYSCCRASQYFTNIRASKIKID
jgi:hypothetical protein